MDYVLRNGIDVEPTDAVIYADTLGKAFEYAEWPKLVLVLEATGLQRTFCEVPASIEPEELAKLRLRFPTMLESEDRTTLWLSRLKADDRRITTSYECEYASWIEGSPFDVLKALLLFARPEDKEELIACGQKISSAAPPHVLRRSP